MFTTREYIVAESLDQAYELLIKGKNNAILGGLLWLKMGNKNIGTAIDLSNLGLDKIEEDDEYFRIGCMTTLRDFEKSEELNNYFNGILRESVSNIVGVQFRNCATIGGSVYSRFGFSDILTALLSLDTYVEMHNAGIIPLKEFVDMPYERDILVRIIIKKDKELKGKYLTHRLSKTDLPVLAVSVTKSNNEWKVVVGGRPSKAEVSKEASKILSENNLSEDIIEKACSEVVKELNFGSNLRGSKEFREILAKALVKRGVNSILGGNYGD